MANQRYFSFFESLKQLWIIGQKRFPHEKTRAFSLKALWRIKKELSLMVDIGAAGGRSQT
jgi:hypothetical protein